MRESTQKRYITRRMLSPGVLHRIRRRMCVFALCWDGTPGAHWILCKRNRDPHKAHGWETRADPFSRSITLASGGSTHQTLYVYYMRVSRTRIESYGWARPQDYDGEPRALGGYERAFFVGVSNVCAQKNNYIRRLFREKSVLLNPDERAMHSWRKQYTEIIVKKRLNSWKITNSYKSINFEGVIIVYFFIVFCSLKSGVEFNKTYLLI